jgi:hypothetical protein
MHKELEVSTRPLCWQGTRNTKTQFSYSFCVLNSLQLTSSGVAATRRQLAAKVYANADLLACHGGDAFLSASQKAELEAICDMIAQPGKGITACDEGPATIGSRFEAVRLKPAN